MYSPILYYTKGEIDMPDYKKMYHKLFNAMTDAIENMKQAQIEAEEIYINSSEQDVVKLQAVEKISSLQSSGKW